MGRSKDNRECVNCGKILSSPRKLKEHLTRKFPCKAKDIQNSQPANASQMQSKEPLSQPQPLSINNSSAEDHTETKQVKPINNIIQGSSITESKESNDNIIQELISKQDDKTEKQYTNIETYSKEESGYL